MTIADLNGRLGASGRTVQPGASSSVDEVIDGPAAGEVYNEFYGFTGSTTDIVSYYASVTLTLAACAAPARRRRLSRRRRRLRRPTTTDGGVDDDDVTTLRRRRRRCRVMRWCCRVWRCVRSRRG